MPIPTLLAVGAVHQHLLKTGQRGKAALFADCGDVKEVHDVALAVGFGADGVCPRVAYEALAKLRHDGLIHAKMRNDIPSPDDVPDCVEIKFRASHAIDATLSPWLRHVDGVGVHAIFLRIPYLTG